MARAQNIFKDRDKVIFQYPQQEGKPIRIDEYWCVRGGISWPAANSPGYWCVFGLKDEPTLTTKEKPLIFLAEGEDPLITKFFEILTLEARRLFCEWLFANMEDNKAFVASLRKFVRERKIADIRLRDSSEFEGFEYNMALIRQRLSDDALTIPEDTILGKQIRPMTPDDLKDKPEERFYAVAALSRVFGSFEAFPFSKPSKQFTGFSNWKNRIKKPISGGYQEYYVE